MRGIVRAAAAAACTIAQAMCTFRPREKEHGGLEGTLQGPELPIPPVGYNICCNMELKLRKIGNSYGVILPGEVLKALQVREGGTLTLLPNEKGFQLTAEDAEFDDQMAIARSLIARYRQTLRELAK